MLLSVIVPTYNPSPSRLAQTLESLKDQTFPYKFWELIVIDNNSTSRVADQINFSWHPNSKLVFEPTQGLTFARLRGFRESKGDTIVMVDDDNLLNKNYLQDAINIFQKNKYLGAIGGKSLPLFETCPPDWIREFMSSLAVRDIGNQIIIEKWENKYPNAAPIGAGMVIRKEALKSYILKIASGRSIITDRNGKYLGSGGDNDIIIEILMGGWSIGYFPTLIIQHIIPQKRMQVNYLSRLINSTNKSWIEVLENHGINPWNKIPGWTVPLRKLKAWFVYKALLNKVNYIKWRGACGTFDGLSENNYHDRTVDLKLAIKNAEKKQCL